MASNTIECSRKWINSQHEKVHRRLSNTRMRPPQSGLVQVGFEEVEPRGNNFEDFPQA
jgi:hypothetical protein